MTKDAVAARGLVTSLLYADGMPPGLVMALHQAWARTYVVRTKSADVSVGTELDRPIHVAFVSGVFANSVVFDFVLGILKHLDRRQFTLHLFSTRGRDDGDAITDWLETRKSLSWHDISNVPAETAAAAIAAAKTDIAIYLDGLTSTGRPDIAALRPAPVQINYLGYPCTWGLPGYRISDVVADPPGSSDAARYSEQLLRLPESFLLWSPRSPPRVLPPPSVKNGFVTFGSYNNPRKITATRLASWKRILDRVPDSRLVFKHATTGESAAAPILAQMCARTGIDLRRVSVLRSSNTSAAQHESYGEIDIALDTGPYGGTTTTVEAAYAGVPTVTVAGEWHAERVGASINASLQTANLTAASLNDYEDIAVNLAGDRDRLAALRNSLPTRLLTSPLGNPEQFLPAFEHLLHDVHRKS